MDAMPQPAGDRSRVEQRLLLAALLYFLNAVINTQSRGWRDMVWAGWALMGICFLITARLPETKRQSVGWMFRDPSGLAILGLHIVALVLLLAPLTSRRSAVGDRGPDEQMVEAGGAGVVAFHARISKRQYDDVCRTAEPEAFRSITRVPCSEFLAYVHQQLGSVMDTRRTEAFTLGDRLGYVVGLGLNYSTRYERGEARERFQWRIEGSQVTLSSYSIDWDAASR